MGWSEARKRNSKSSASGIFELPFTNNKINKISSLGRSGSRIAAGPARLKYCRRLHALNFILLARPGLRAPISSSTQASRAGHPASRGATAGPGRIILESNLNKRPFADFVACLKCLGEKEGG